MYLDEVRHNAENFEDIINADKKKIQKITKAKLEGGPPLVDAISTTQMSTIVMIEGKIYREGYFVNGFKIKKINKRSVEFEKDGQVWLRRMD
jgi:hypothetical protein